MLGKKFTGEAALSSFCEITSLFAVGLASRIEATTPATNGEAIEVPLNFK
jgi:hypothetical protein